MDFKSGNRRRWMNPYIGVMWATAVCVALLIVAYGMIATKPEKGSEGTAKPSGGGAPAEETTPPAKAHRAVVVATLEPEPQGVTGKKIPPYLTDPETLKKEPGSAAIGTFPFFYLLYQAEIGDQATVVGQAVPAPGAAKMADWEPGKAVSLEGTIVAMESRVDLGIPEAGIRSATQHRIEDATGGRYLVFAVHAMRGVGPGDTVNVVGRYLRLYDDPEAADGTRGDALATPVIVARQVDGSKYLEDASCLDEVRDGTLGHLAKPFFYLANRVGKMSQSELIAKADGTLTPDILERFPKKARGKAVAIDGNIVLPPQAVDETPNIAGTGPTYWTILRTRPGLPVWVYALEKPEGFLKGDAVRVHGLFFMSRKYRKEGFERTALIVVARRLIPVTVGESQGLALAVVIGGVIIVILLVIGVSLERRTGRKFNRHVHDIAAKARPRDLNRAAREATRRARERKGAPGAGNQPPSPDEAADESH